MNRLTFASLAAVAACSGAPVIQQSAPEVGDTQGSTQRQALVALEETHAGWRNNGDFIYCTSDATRIEIENLVKEKPIYAGKGASSLLEDETKHRALEITGGDLCDMKSQDKGKELQGRECLMIDGQADLQKKKPPKPSTFSVPVSCEDADEPAFTCTSSLIIKDIGRNDTGDDVCVRVGVEKTELIPTSQTPLPLAPESN